MAGLRSNANFSSVLLTEVGTCTNDIRIKRKEAPSKRKICEYNHRELEITMESIKPYRKYRNRLMGKENKCSSRYKTKKSKRKMTIRYSNCKEVGHSEIRCVKAPHEDDSHLEKKNTNEVKDIKNLFS